tara:strand:- start:160 stop:384 length:225 start_codon:yes stop_codon:yes gene_type:complete
MKWEMNDAFKVSLIRAVRTGLQAGLGVIIAAQSGWLDMSVLEGAVVAAGAAFFSALQNVMEEAPFKFMSNVPKG